MLHKQICTTRSQACRGVALITTLLLLSLFTVMTLAMVIATTSDTLIDGYYRNLRGSFYAADSGLNAARQYFINQFSADVPATYAPFSGPPIAPGTENTVLSGLTNTSSGFGGFQSVLGSQASSWPGAFKVDSTNTTLSAPTCTPSYTKNATGDFSTPPSCTSTGSNGYTLNSYTYSYPYQITVIGQSRANEQNTVVETGNLSVVVNIASSATNTTSFAAYGTFFDKYALCGNPFVAGTMSGPFFSNQSWNFGDSGWVGSSKYIFTDPVGAVNSQVGYRYSSDGACDQSNKTSDTHKGVTINPTFQGGLNLSQNSIPLPQDSYNQQRAVLDGMGACSVSPCPAVTQSEMNADHLTDVHGNVWPATGSTPTSGVYIPYTTQAGGACPCTFTGGGIYVQGNTDQVTLSAGTTNVSGSTHKTQVFAINQGSTTTTVTLDLDGNTTTISDGSTSKTINGIPENLGASPPTEAAMLYVNGNISNTSGSTATGLSGPSSGAAIQNGSALTVTASGTIAITGNLTYSTEPVTLNTSDTLVSPSPTNVFGIFTPTGDIQLRVPNAGQNLEIDASLAMISNGGSGGLINTWNQINTLTIVGGRIANQAKQGNVTTRNIWFDRRFLQGGFAPPWFPATTVTTSGTTSATVSPNVTATRVLWVNTSAM
jgi:Tfp pilus assembly protein PilX